MQTERGRRLDRAFGAVAPALEPRERAFAHELAYGVTRLRGRLDHLLAQHVRRPLSDLDAHLLELLRLGAYQILYMDAVPPYAAVAQTVEHAKERLGKGPAGLVNAVLRRLSEAGDGLERFPSERDDPAGFLSSWGSHPRWLVERWLDRWGRDPVRALVEANNRRPRVHVVPLDGEPAHAAAHLARHGIEAEPVGEGTGCVRLSAGSDAVDALRVLPASIIQDPGANLVTVHADVPRGGLLVDLCAAPGGKVLAVSARPSLTLAADRSESRIGMVMENIRRAGRSIACVVADARRPPLTTADVVLLDVPCSGTGTLSRHPDARWRLAEETIDALADLQREMLRAAAPVVARGGLLVYSTCTLEPEENESQVDRFLDEHPDFGVEPTAAVPTRYLDERGCLRVLPGVHGFDGAYAARMRKAA